MSIFQYFPFTNAHQLNLDWILETLQTFPRTVNNTLPDDNGNINLPTVAGMSSWNGIGADGAGNVDPAEHISDLDNAAEGFHIYKWTDPTDSNTPYDATYFLARQGHCYSGKDNNGYITQISSGFGGNILALRSYIPGDGWSSWMYINPHVIDRTGDITFSPTMIDDNEPYEIVVKEKMGWVSVYFEAKTLGSSGNNDPIASGFPVPAYRQYSLGYIIDALTSDIIPCRYEIDGYGHLNFGTLGNASNTHDVLIASFTYPLAT